MQTLIKRSRGLGGCRSEAWRAQEKRKEEKRREEEEEEECKLQGVVKVVKEGVRERAEGSCQRAGAGAVADGYRS